MSINKPKYKGAPSARPGVSPRARMGLSAWVLAAAMLTVAAGCSEDDTGNVEVSPCGAEFIKDKPCDANPNPGKGEHCRAPGKEVCNVETGEIECDPNEPVVDYSKVKELPLDGIDNNCNGETDETDPEGIGEDCKIGAGACEQTGVRVLEIQEDGTYGTKCTLKPGEEPIEPADSDPCDGVDNDCDEEVDEDEAERPCGECGEGVQACVDGEFGGCEGEDTENELDADCDNGQLGACKREGKIDCDVDEDGNPVKACKDKEGELVGAVEPAPAELCTLGDEEPEDEDCDGETDEGFEAKGDPCEEGQGACRAEGNEICSEDLLALVCDAEEGEPVPEICGNGEDDDCDREIDELEFEGEIVEEGVPCFGGFVINSIDCSVPGNYACSEGLVICDKDVAAEAALIAQSPICDANCNNLVDRFPFVPLSEGSTRMISEGEISIQNVGGVRACVDLDARPAVNRTRTDFRSFIAVTAGARGFLPSIVDFDEVCSAYEPNPDAVDNYGVEILPASDFPNSFYVALFNPDFMIFGFSGNAASMTEDGDYYGTDINGNDAQDTCGRVRNGNNGARNSTVGAHMGVETGDIEE